MKINFKKFKDVLVPAIVVVIIIVGVVVWYYINQKSKGTLTAQAAAEKSISFINQNYLQGQATAALGEVSEESGVYKFQFKTENQDYTAYVTKDGKLLFPSGAPMTETQNNNNSTGGNIPKTETPQALLFVMSFCPYGNQAEEVMMPVVDLLKDKADIQLHYVIYSNYQGGGASYCLDKENKYCSMHGIQELNQDVRELCVQKYQPDKFWGFVKAINAGCSAQNVDSCWENIAKANGIDTAKIKTCQKNEALTLLEQEVQLNTAFKISGSPQLVINATEFSGSRTADGYKSAICSAFDNLPTECSQTLRDSGSTAPATGGCE